MILEFINSIYEIRNKKKYYIVFELWGSTPFSRKLYKLLHESEIDNYRKSDNYSRTNIGEVRVGHRRCLRQEEVVGVEIINRAAYKGPPYHVGRPREEATSGDLELLTKIPVHPRNVFKNRKSYEVKIDETKTCSFSADEEAMQAMFDFPISMEEKNYLYYMGHYICLEAGRGTKWFLSGQSRKEFKHLFIYNTGREDLDPAEEEPQYY